MKDTEVWGPDGASPEVAVAAGANGGDDERRVDPDSIEDLGLDQPVRVDERELDEIGAEFDDPEELVTIDGSDDPDGLGELAEHERARRDDAEGWDLDATMAGNGEVQ